ncbi:MAG TPA: hypothetical protein VFX86_03915 [Candidatus Saccharimonadales bacterium]|nr:hypothetical protein [Candidatus Saccharimonadales bacterium]
MLPAGEVDPTQRRLGKGIALLASAAFFLPAGNALANEDSADTEKAALAAFNEAPARNIESFSAPASVATSQVVEHSLSDATTSDLQQDCVKAALKKPKIRFSGMTYPGNNQQQLMQARGEFEPTAEACLSVVTRKTPTLIFKIQNPNNHKKWFKTKPQVLKDIVDYLPIGNKGGIGGVDLGAYRNDRNITLKNKKLLYRCTPGKGVTRVKSVYRLKVASSVDGRTLGRKSYTVPVKIRPLPGKAVLNGGVKGPC